MLMHTLQGKWLLVTKKTFLRIAQHPCKYIYLDKLQITPLKSRGV